jgi:hypothetical protein
MDPLQPAVAEFLLHGPAGEFQPGFVEKFASAIHPGPPGWIGEFIEQFK